MPHRLCLMDLYSFPLMMVSCTRLTSTPEPSSGPLRLDQISLQLQQWETASCTYLPETLLSTLLTKVLVQCSGEYRTSRQSYPLLSWQMASCSTARCILHQ